MLLEIVLVLGFVGFSLAGLWLVRRRVKLETLKEQHDVAAVCFSIVGGLYGIVLAFVLVSSWERFEEARERTEVEANALRDLYRHASGLPQPTREDLRRLTIDYSRSMIDDEWPAMDRDSSSEVSRQIVERIWNTVLATEVTTNKDEVIFQNTLGKMDDFADGRRDRLLYARVGLPPIVWDFLVVYGFVTVAFSYFFGLRRIGPQMLMTAALTATIGATLVIIHEMQTPFRGSVAVQPYGFEQFLDQVERDGKGG